jgi:hypothetical protein
VAKSHSGSALTKRPSGSSCCILKGVAAPNTYTPHIYLYTVSLASSQSYIRQSYTILEQAAASAGLGEINISPLLACSLCTPLSRGAKGARRAAARTPLVVEMIRAMLTRISCLDFEQCGIYQQQHVVSLQASCFQTLLYNT